MTCSWIDYNEQYYACSKCRFLLEKRFGIVNRNCPKDPGTVPVKIPALQTKVKSFLSDSLRFFVSAKGFVTKAQYKERLEICDVCPQRKGNSCGKCGCYLPLKACAVDWHCPEGRWPSLDKMQYNIPDVINDRLGQPVKHMTGIYKGTSCFMICGGPSSKDLDLTQLTQRGLLTFALNNAGSLVRPNIWTHADTPGNFLDGIFRDPGILKLVPIENISKPTSYRDANGHLKESKLKVEDCPNVFTYLRNKEFNSKQFLNEPHVNFGCHKNVIDDTGNKGQRSVMLSALKLAYCLGIRKLFLIGVDFRMTPQESYAFPQNKKTDACFTNNAAYAIMNTRLEALYPRFVAAGFNVYNCNAKSLCTAFPYLSYEAAIETALADFPKVLDPTDMYNKFA